MGRWSFRLIGIDSRNVCHEAAQEVQKQATLLRVYPLHEQRFSRQRNFQDTVMKRPARGRQPDQLALGSVSSGSERVYPAWNRTFSARLIADLSTPVASATI